MALSKIPRRPGEQIKTDVRDAFNLAGLARARELVPVTIPDERDEAIRDFSRARMDAVLARLKARECHPERAKPLMRAQPMPSAPTVVSKN